MEDIVKQALHNLNKSDSYDEFITYLNSEWYYNIEDLLLAIEDVQSWSDIKLPNRLKLEIKKLLSKNVKLLTNNVKSKNHFTNDIELLFNKYSHVNWFKFYSDDDECYYYYNSKTQETSWELDIKEKYVFNDNIFEYNQLNENSQVDDTNVDLNLKSDKSNKIVNNNSINESVIISPSAPLLSIDPMSTSDHNNLPVAYAEASPGYFSPYLRVEDINDSFGLVEELSSESFDSYESFTPDLTLLQRLMDMGYDEESGIQALKYADNDIDTAASYIISKNNKISTSQSNSVKSNSNSNCNSSKSNSNNISNAYSDLNSASSSKSKSPAKFISSQIKLFKTKSSK